MAPTPDRCSGTRLEIPPVALIDACGLKGLRRGGAAVSDKHANFIQADSGARSADVYDLVLEVQRRVEAATGVHLVPELRLVGFGDPS